jgi:delta-1-pyrroline-5-carboxylate synthetase
MVDSKTDYPAACNAIETVLINSSLVPSGAAASLLEAAKQAKITAFGGPRAVQAFGLQPAASLRMEYGELAMAVELVDSVVEAIEHINSHGSGHTDVIVTEDKATAEKFLCGVGAPIPDKSTVIATSRILLHNHPDFVAPFPRSDDVLSVLCPTRADSADVFHNCSSRFADGYRFGLGAEVGISTSRIHARGPVGVEGLLTTRNRLISSSSHIVGDFHSGRHTYTHRDLMPPSARL